MAVLEFRSTALKWCLALVVSVVFCPSRVPAQDADDEIVAVHLAELLRSARTVISQNQTLINDPTRDDKGLTGTVVLATAMAIYEDRTGEDPESVDPDSREGKLLRAQMAAIVDVMSENQGTINAPNVGFKGFIPAVFARLVNENFRNRVGADARIKVTAPEELVRNRRARPDAWEKAVLADKLAKPDWPEGQPFSEVVPVEGRTAFRLIVPEYYAASCLSCHGGPKGETDITGYPKEGGEEGDLGAAISVTLFR